MLNQNQNMMNKNEENEITNDIIYHKYNLFQQFFAIGLEPKISHLINKMELKAIPEPLIGPKIITKYPNDNIPYLNIPDSLIISHCFPNGFKNSIIECPENNLMEKLNITYDFIFSLDNYQRDKKTSIRINKVYFACYFFYEKLEDYLNCINFKKNNEKKTNLNKIYLIPKVISLSSFSPYIQQSKLLLHYIKKYVDNMKYNKLTDINISIYGTEDKLPLEKIIEGLIYNIPGLPRADFVMKINKNNFVSDSQLNIESNFNETLNEIIFESSAPNKKMKPIINYTLLMKFFKIDEIFEIIKCIILEEPILFFCKNIEYLTYTIEGILSLIYPFEYHFPVVAVLPEENYSFINVYKSFIFGINYTYSEEIFLFKGINLDDQKNINIVIIENRFNNPLNNNEKEKNKTSVILNFHPNNSKYLKISQKTINNSILETKELYMKKKSMLGMNKEEEKIDDKNENDKKLKLPSHYYGKCCKKFENNLEVKFKELKSKYKDINSKNAEIEKEKILNDEIIEIFLYFFTSIFLHYQEYCTKLKYVYDSNVNKYGKNQGYYLRDIVLEKKYYTNTLTINDLFNCDLFIDEMPNLDKPFYIKFLKTKIFFNFMKKKIFPQSTQDKLDILFFDDKVNEKLSREVGMKKIDTKFLEYDTTNITGEITINTLSKAFSEKFNEYLFDDKNRDKGINYYQYIVNQTSDDIKNRTSIENYYSTNNASNIDFKISCYYFVFPKLLNDGLFYKDYKKEDELNNLWSTTNFTSKNSNCLYNQFEKEGNAILNNENIIKNYNNYYYCFNPIQSYSKSYDHYVKILYLQYFSKVFHQIPYSKKQNYFNYVMYFMTKNKNFIDENSIMMMFNTIIKYGDKDMAQYFFPFIKNKTYTIFLILREKTRPDKNICYYNKKEIKNNNDDSKDENNIDNDVFKLSKKGGSFSGFNSNNVRLSAISVSNEKKKISSIDGEEKNNENGDANTNENISKKDYEIFYNEEFNFNVNLFCTHKKGDILCNNPIDLNLDNIFDENKTYIEYKCTKCETIQPIIFTSKYKDENNDTYIIKSKLYSPSALLESDWFKNSYELNLNNITQEHLDEYISAIFYFYEQDLLSDFLIPEIITKKDLTIESNSTKTQKVINDKKIEIKINEVKNNITNINDKPTIPRSSLFDISDQKHNFFEFKSTPKNIKPSSLISHNIKKKNNPMKKSVGFAVKNKKPTPHKKNSLSYSNFLNNN